MKKLQELLKEQVLNRITELFRQQYGNKKSDSPKFMDNSDN